MTGQLVVLDDGIEIKGRFRSRFYSWNDIAGFWLREGKPLGGIMGGTSPVITETSDEGWVTVRGGDQHRLKGIKTDEQVLELNRRLEEGRRRTSNR